MTGHVRTATVQDVMSVPVWTIAPHAGLKEAAARLRRAGCSALPVVDREGRVVGVLSEADLLVKAERPAPAAARSYTGRLERRRWSGTVVAHLMTSPAVVVRPDATLPDAARLMHRHGLKRLPVVDEPGRPVGMVSRGELLQVFLRENGEIRRGVKERLGGDRPAGLAVSVEEGIVVLRGPLAEPEPLRRMMESAGAVDGVIAVRAETDGPATTPGEARRFPVSGSTTDIEVLSEQECLELLRSHRVGRIALSDHGQPLIFPVNYGADDRAVVFRTAPGMKLTEAPMSRVAFEIDEVDTAAGVAWSVMVQGVAYEITSALDQLSTRMRELVVEPMAPGERRNWIAVVRREISGRRFRLQPVE